MKKILALCAALVMGVAAMTADSVPVKDGNKTVGRVSYSYTFQETSRGCFTHISIENESGETVSLQFQTNEGGCETVTLRPYGRERDLMIGTTEVPTRVFVTNGQASVR